MLVVKLGVWFAH